MLLYNSYTKRYETSIYRQVKQSMIEQVSQNEGLSRDQVEGIFKRQLEVIDVHKAEELIARLESLWTEEERLRVEEVSIDMWAGFTKVVRRVFPKARIVKWGLGGPLGLG
ncbi:MAG: transposase [Thermostichus sp. HHBFW_bins_43]